MKIAVIVKDGFEELEMLGIVDMARRMNVECHIVGCDSDSITGSHEVEMKANTTLEQMDSDYDAIVLPGGPGAVDLRDDQRVVNLVKHYHENDKLVAAICAAPIVLEKAGILKGKTVTAYPTVEDELVSANYIRSLVEVDGKIITANGPAATFAFAFAILEHLGLDTKALREGSQYAFLMAEK